MNIFKINENIACNAFSFIGYIYFVLIVINYQTKYASINPLIILIDFLVFSLIGYIYAILLLINYKKDFYCIISFIILIDFLAFLTVIVILLIIYFREIKIYDKHPRIRKEYENNTKALLYYYTGIILHILIILVVLLISPIKTHLIFNHILYFG